MVASEAETNRNVVMYIPNETMLRTPSTTVIFKTARMVGPFGPKTLRPSLRGNSFNKRSLNVYNSISRSFIPKAEWCFLDFRSREGDSEVRWEDDQTSNVVAVDHEKWCAKFLGVGLFCQLGISNSSSSCNSDHQQGHQSTFNRRYGRDFRLNFRHHRTRQIVGDPPMTRHSFCKRNIYQKKFR